MIKKGNLNKKCIFRGDRSGVFFGTLVAKRRSRSDYW